MKDERPKRHHLVPQFYLKRFAVDDRIRVASRANLSASYEARVDTTLFEREFYSIETDEGLLSDVETFFATHVEGPAARTLRRVVDDGVPPVHALRERLSIFLAFQCLRGQAMRAGLLSHHERIAKRVAALMTPEMARKQLRDAEGAEPTQAEMMELVEFAHDVDGYNVSFSREANLHLGAVLPAALDLVPFFARRTWLLLKFDEPLLITGDEPIALIGASTIPGDPVGLVAAREVVFPADPWNALVLVRPDKEAVEGTSRGTPRMADVINRHVAFGCHRSIVYRPGTDPLRGMVLPVKNPSTKVFGDYVTLQKWPTRSTP